jgi:hypothetical protein
MVNICLQKGLIGCTMFTSCSVNVMSYVSCFDQVEVSNKFQTVEKLKQYYLFIPLKVIILIVYIFMLLKIDY